MLIVTRSGRLGERGLHFLLVGEQFPHARALLHPLEMPRAILELGKIEVELRATSKAPEKVGIDGGEMVEEPLAIGELVVRDLVVFEQLAAQQAATRTPRHPAGRRRVRAN